MPEIFWSVTPLPYPLDCVTSDLLAPLPPAPSCTVPALQSHRQRLHIGTSFYTFTDYFYWCWGIRFHGTCSEVMSVKLKNIKGLSGWPSGWCKVRICSPALPSCPVWVAWDVGSLQTSSQGWTVSCYSHQALGSLSFPPWTVLFKWQSVTFASGLPSS